MYGTKTNKSNFYFRITDEVNLNCLWHPWYPFREGEGVIIHPEVNRILRVLAYQSEQSKSKTSLQSIY